MYCNNTIKSLIVACACFCFSGIQAGKSESITLDNKADHPVYAAIYYKGGYTCSIGSGITTIAPGKSATITLPRYKWFKKRQLLVSKDAKKLTESVSWITIDLPSNFLGCHYEVGYYVFHKGIYTGKLVLKLY